MTTTAGSFYLAQPYPNCKADYILSISDPRYGEKFIQTAIELKITVTNADTGKHKTTTAYSGTTRDPQTAAQELINEYAQMLAYQLTQDEEARRQQESTDYWRAWQKIND